MLSELSKKNFNDVLKNSDNQDYWMEYRAGNILNQYDLDYIVHQANCFHTMSAGVAAAISTKYPNVFNADKHTKFGDKEKMGGYSSAIVNMLPPGENVNSIRFFPTTIINLYSQYAPGAYKDKKEYNERIVAMKNGLTTLRDDIINFTEPFGKVNIGIPWMIGCGISGMDTNTVFELIRSVFKKSAHKIKIIFVDFNA